LGLAIAFHESRHFALEGYPVAPSYCSDSSTGCGFEAARSIGRIDQGAVRRLLDHHYLLCESKEDLSWMPRATSVEPKGVFVEVSLQMLIADGTLVRTQQPTL